MENININGNKATWIGELVSETSFTRTDLGEFTNTMEFGFVKNNKNQGYIEWVFEKVGNPNSQDVVEIGLYFENKELVDYDGVFELPEPAILLLESLGFDVSFCLRLIELDRVDRDLKK